MSESANTVIWQEKLNNLSIVVIIPTYNNDKTLLSVIEGVKLYCKHIIVVDDGSTDNTSGILESVSGIQTITHPGNKGKGYALKNGLSAAKEQGFRYAITIDSDGQHSPADIPVFVNEIEAQPDTMLVGARDLMANNMPGKNTFANKFSNFWFQVETGIKLEDTQSGYRLYPLHCIGKMKYCTAGYEFELEMIVFLAWKGVNVKNIPVNVYYPPQGERVSHFRPLRDFTRISILNTVLVIITFLWILPVKFFRKLTWTNIRAFIDKEILKSKDSNKTITLSIMLGIFMGIVPIWGYQMIVTVFLAHFSKLNKVISLVASNISIPPIMPFLLYGSYATGCFLTNSPMSFDIADISLERMKTVLFQYLTGSIAFALVCSVLAGIISACLLLIFRKSRRATDI
jgi:glycosyltransferase involved in cell wall biosynthesis